MAGLFTWRALRVCAVVFGLGRAGSRAQQEPSAPTEDAVPASEPPLLVILEPRSRGSQWRPLSLARRRGGAADPGNASDVVWSVRTSGAIDVTGAYAAAARVRKEHQAFVWGAAGGRRWVVCFEAGLAGAEAACGFGATCLSVLDGSEVLDVPLCLPPHAMVPDALGPTTGPERAPRPPYRPLVVKGWLQRLTHGNIGPGGGDASAVGRTAVLIPPYAEPHDRGEAPHDDVLHRFHSNALDRGRGNGSDVLEAAARALSALRHGAPAESGASAAAFRVTAVLTGGLGNQLFQVFGALAYCLAHGAACELSDEGVEGGDYGRDTYWETVFKGVAALRRNSTVVRAGAGHAADPAVGTAADGATGSAGDAASAARCSGGPPRLRGGGTVLGLLADDAWGFLPLPPPPRGVSAAAALHGFFQSFRYFGAPAAAEVGAVLGLGGLRGAECGQLRAHFPGLPPLLQKERTAPHSNLNSSRGSGSSGDGDGGGGGFDGDGDNGDGGFDLDGSEDSLVTISLHFRIGDYVRLGDYYHVQPVEYYERALKHLLDRTMGPVAAGQAHAGPAARAHVLVFCHADDRPTVGAHVAALELAFRCDPRVAVPFHAVPAGLPDWRQLLLMSCASAHAIANSSFSWWAAFLHELLRRRGDSAAVATTGDGTAGKGTALGMAARKGSNSGHGAEEVPVAYPSLHFGPAHIAHFHKRDMYPAHWTEVSAEAASAGVRVAVKVEEQVVASPALPPLGAACELNDGDGGLSVRVEHPISGGAAASPLAPVLDASVASGCLADDLRQHPAAWALCIELDGAMPDCHSVAGGPSGIPLLPLGPPGQSHAIRAFFSRGGDERTRFAEATVRFRAA